MIIKNVRKTLLLVLFISIFIISVVMIASADSCPMDFKDKDNRNDGNIDVCVNGSYIFTTQYKDGYVDAYSYDGATLTYINTIDVGIRVIGIDTDGTYIYPAVYSDGIVALTFNGTGFTNVGSRDDAGTSNELTNIYCDGSYIYCTFQLGGIRVYSFNGTAFALLNATDPGDSFIDVTGDGTYIYFSNLNDGVFAYTFNGTALTLVDSLDNGGTYGDIDYNDGKIYVSCASRIGIYSFNGTNLSYDDSITIVTSRVCADDTYIYTSATDGSPFVEPYVLSVYDKDLDLVCTDGDSSPPTGLPGYLYSNNTNLFTCNYEYPTSSRSGLSVYNINSFPQFDNLSVSPITGMEDDVTFYFNVSCWDLWGGNISGNVYINISLDGVYTNNSMTWVEGSNITGANYTYSTILSAPGIYTYVFSATDGIDWNETTPSYVEVTGGSGHYISIVHISYYDTMAGLGISPYLFKIYLSDDTTINSDDRIYFQEYYTYTGYTYYYKVTDFFDNTIYPLTGSYESILIDKDHFYLDIPITWYDLAIKNLNVTIMHFSMNNGSRYYNITLFPMDSININVLSGEYNITKTYYSASNGTVINTLYDNITIASDDFYIATGYDAMVHISWYNTNEGLGIPDETLKVYIDGERQISMSYWTYINKTINVTIKDYYNLTMYTGNFTITSTYTFLDLGLTFHSWLFGNKNDDYYMISLLKQGGSRWWERGIVPYGEREFLIPSGSYMMRIYDKDDVEIYNSSAYDPIVNSRVYVIHGTNLSLIIDGQSVIRGQLLELQSELDYALMPDDIIWACNPPTIFSVYDRTGMMLGANVWKVCPVLDVIGTTRNTSYSNNTNSYPLIPTNGTTANGTISVLTDAIYISGNGSVNWVNITYLDNGTLMQNTTYIPGKLNLNGENLTINASCDVHVLRETTFSKVTKFYWNIYNSTTNPGHISGRAGYHSTVLNVQNTLSVPLYDVYVFAGFSDKTIPDLNTIQVEDLENGVLLEQGEDYKSTNGIEFRILDGLNASQTRAFDTGYYKDISHTYYYEDAQTEIKVYTEEKTFNDDGEFYNYAEVRWINDNDKAFRGSLRVKIGFDCDLDKDSVKVYDLDENSLINDEHIIVGDEFIWIASNAMGSIQSGGGRTFGIYFQEIVYPGTNLLEVHLATPVGDIFGIMITPFMIIFAISCILILVGTSLIVKKWKYKRQYGTLIMIGVVVIIIFWIFQSKGV